MQYQANKPRLTTKGKAKLAKSSIVKTIKTQWSERQAYQKTKHKWTGWISPSSYIKLDMCVEEYFEEAISKAFDPPDNRLFIINVGSLIHVGFMDAMKWIKGMRYSVEPTYSDPELAEWAKKVFPEFPIWCKKTGWKGKIDMIIERKGRPVVVDLKNSFIPIKRWREQFNEPILMHHLGQLLIYANRLNASKCFPKKVKEICILQINWLEVPFSRYWAKESILEYEPYRERTNAFVRAFAVGWRQHKAGKRVTCLNPDCYIHGRSK